MAPCLQQSGPVDSETCSRCRLPIKPTDLIIELDYATCIHIRCWPVNGAEGGHLQFAATSQSIKRPIPARTRGSATRKNAA